MMTSFSGITFSNITQNMSIVPRLEYSTHLLSDIINTLENKRIEISKSNNCFLNENNDAEFQKSVDFEKTIVFAIEIVSQIQKRTFMISNIFDIPKILSSAILMIRTISAQLFGIFPECSLKLSELSVHLGSIVLDSAALTKAKCDFNLANAESTIFLDEVKLMVDSKINKLYPNFEFLK